MPSRPKRMLRIVSKCASREEFLTMFRRFSTEDTLFIVTGTPKPAGHRLGFSIGLEDGEPMIRGIGEVVASHATGDNPFRRPGMEIRFDEVDGPSRQLLDELRGRGRTSADDASQPATNLDAGPKSRANTPPPIPKLQPPKVAGATPPERVVPGPGDDRRAKEPEPGGLAPPAPEDDGAAEEAEGPPTVTDGEAAERAAAAAEAAKGAADTSAEAPEVLPDQSAGITKGASAEPRARGGAAEALGAGDDPPRQATSVRATRAPEPDAEGTETGAARVPGAPTVLPANPFGDVPAASLDGFVECTLYEETAAGLPAAPPEELEPEETPPPVAHPLGGAHTLSARVPARPPADPEAESPAEPTPGPGAPYYEPPAVTGAPVAAASPSLPGVPADPEGASAVQPEGALAAQSASFSAGHDFASPAAVRVPKPSRRTVTLAAAGLGTLVLVAILLATMRGDAPTEKRAAPGENRAGDAENPVTGAAAKGANPAGAGGGDSAVPRDPAGAGSGAAPAAGEDQSEPAADVREKGKELAPEGGEELRESAADAAAGDTAHADASVSGSEAPPEAEDGTCRATIKSAPRAKVYGAGRRLGTTPLEVELPCGEVELAFRRERYVDEDRTVTLRPGEPATIEVGMRRPRFRVRIKSRPEGAGIYVSGRRVGRTPATIRLPGYAFSRVQVKKRGYKTWRERVFPSKPRTFIRVRLRRHD